MEIKKFIYKMISWCLLVFNKIIVKILTTFNIYHLSIIEKLEEYNNSSPIENRDNYEVLLPNTKTDKDKHYSNPFTVALKTPHVNNIAVTGAYGSGKSSFLRTFERENSEWCYLPISLATFKDTQEDIEEKEEPKDDKPSSSKDNKEATEESKEKSDLHQDIERSILQQFFYREKDEDVRYSRFKKIRNIRKKWIWIHSILVAFMVSYSFLMYRPEKFKKLFLVNPLELLDSKYHKFLVLIFIGTVVFYLYKLFHYLQNIQISKFNFKKGEITLAKQDKASILNEHLDEILYFFEVTEYDVVLFEDIDRFDDTEIFIKLRELNNLINNSKQIGRRVRFVYAIRDDMFVDKERTKFFDFIIPIIPYINPSNSEIKLLEKFEQEVKDKNIDENFISQVSLYIDDMRLLLNIYNEYIVYKNNLDSNKLNHNQILALVVCKNFYPLDFAKLHNREGIIYDLFDNKPQYIKRQIEEYNQKIIKKRNQLLKIQNEHLSSISELRMIYIYKLFVKLSATQVTASINGHRRNWGLDDLNSDEIFEDIIKNDISFESNNNYYNSYSFSSIEKEVNTNQTYLERKSYIENKFNNKVNDLKKEIEKIDKQINQLKQTTLKQLFEISSHIITKNYESKNLLIFLVRNGYIDEYYEHYISYFHKGGITQDDREFLLNIQNHNTLDWSFKLGNIRKLLEKLNDKNFEQIEILNFNLTDFLLNDYSNKADIYFKKVSDGSELYKNFIFEYIDNTLTTNKKKFIKRLQWKNLWFDIYNNFSNDKQREYFSLIFRALESNEIIELNISNSLKEYLEKQTTFPKYPNIQNEKYKELISEFELEFKNIENPSNNEELFDYIYNNRHYELSKKMIEIMLNEKGNIDIKALEDAHLTTIRNSEAEELKRYIDANITKYIENIFLDIDSNTKEAKEIIIDLLNNKDISFENRVKIIQKEEAKILDINDVKNKEIWIELFKDNKIVASWDNILYYYQETEELSKEIINYLNIKENHKELFKYKIDNEEDFNYSLLNDLNIQILLCNEILNEAYSYLIQSIQEDKYHNLDMENLSSIKIDILLRENKIVLSQDSIDRLKENFAPKHISLIENFKDEFLEKFDEFSIFSIDILKLIKSKKFTNSEKFQIIELTDLSFFEENKELREGVSNLYISQNKKIEVSLFEKLFYGQNNYNFRLLISQIPYLDDCDSCKIYLDEFGEPYDKLLENAHGYVQINDTNINQLLLKALKEKDCIGEYPIKRKKINAYRKWTN